MLQSGSTHQPPMTWNLFSATRSRMVANSSGSLSSIHWRYTTESHVKTNSGYSSMRSTADWKVARTSWYPSGPATSHTGSMCALPIMCRTRSLTPNRPAPPTVDLLDHEVQQRQVHLLDARGLGRRDDECTGSACSAAAPSPPVKTTVVAPCSRAAASARTTFAERPLVVNPTTTSPEPTTACTWRANTSSKE